MLKLFFNQKTNENTVEDYVFQVQDGNEHIRTDLIESYKPFVSKTVSSVCKRYIDDANDDEYSIGLIAFNEAINHYTNDKGSSFLSFATLVIKRRVIDYIRKEKKYIDILTSAYEDDEKARNMLESAAATEQFQLDIEAEQRMEEIIHFSERLSEFGVSFTDLTAVSPKHEDTRNMAISIARALYTDFELRTKLFKTKKLSVKELLKKVSVSKKTIERNRKYIIAIVIILSEDYRFLKEYLKEVGL